MNDTTTLTVLKLLGKGRGLTFVAQALKLEPKDVLAVAREHGVVRKTGEMDAAAAAYAAAKLATAPRLPERTAPQRPARETMPGQATAAVAPRRNPPPPATRTASSPTPAPRPVVETPRPVVPAAGAKPLPGYVLVDVALIDTDGRNVRRALGDLDELAASILEVGILQPLTLLPKPGGRYTVGFGHRRLAAAKRAGLTEVPCIIRSRPTDITVRVERLIENLQRAQLEPLEEAEAFDQLIEEGLTQTEVARRVGISAATVSTRLALLALPADAKQMLRDGALPLTEAMKLGAQVRAKGAGRVHNKAPQQPDYWATHRLAEELRRTCDHYGRRRYGRVGCGPCIEAAIRSDEGLRLLTTPTSRKDHPA